MRVRVRVPVETGSSAGGGGEGGEAGQEGPQAGAGAANVRAGAGSVVRWGRDTVHVLLDGDTEQQPREFATAAVTEISGDGKLTSMKGEPVIDALSGRIERLSAADHLHATQRWEGSNGQTHGAAGRRDSRNGSDTSAAAVAPMTEDALVLLDPSIELTMPGLNPPDARELRTRVLERVGAQVAEIEKRVLRRRDQMDQLGFVPQKHNQTRAEALLKLEVRKRVRIDEIKQAVLSEMWRERAAAEPQEGLFANLEAKLINILDAVGSVDNIGATTGTKQRTETVSPPRRSQPKVARGSDTTVAVDDSGGLGRRWDPATSPPAPKSNILLRQVDSALTGAAVSSAATAGGGLGAQASAAGQEVLVGATEEELLAALRAKRQERAAAADRAENGAIMPEKAEKAAGPWRELPAWTQRTQRLRQAGNSPENNPRALATLSDEDEDEDDERGSVIPTMVKDVPHMFGDAASLHAGEVQIKGVETVAVPDGHDWLLSSPHAGEDHLLASAPSRAQINAGRQGLLVGAGAAELNASGPLDLLEGLDDLGDLDLDLDISDDLLKSPPSTAAEADDGAGSSSPLQISGRRGSVVSSSQATSSRRGSHSSGGSGSAANVQAAVASLHAAPSSSNGLPGEAAPAPAPAPASLLTDAAAAAPVVDTAERQMLAARQRRMRGKQIRAERKRQDPAATPEPAPAAAAAATACAPNPEPVPAPSSSSSSSASASSGLATTVALPVDAQRRLEVVWADLRMPVMHKLDMAVKYTAVSAQRSTLVNEALPLWETAATAVTRRERALEALSAALLPGCSVAEPSSTVSRM
jgi:hypothetical protein